MDLGIRGRRAVVGGASKGLGRACARALAAEGVAVAIVARTESELVKTAQALEAETGSRVLPVAADLSSEDGRKKVLRAFPDPDILVNNAGGPPPGVTLPRGSFLDAADLHWQAMFEFNLFSAVRAVRAAIPMMLTRGGGSIINISSTVARQPSPINLDYCAAKAGQGRPEHRGQSFV
jgi:NAD(P)-dependent dehydrogenase (short-subunit alcohol dehydrogenase family)